MDEETVVAAGPAKGTAKQDQVLAGRVGALLLVVGSWQLAHLSRDCRPLLLRVPVGDRHAAGRLGFVNGTAYGSLWLQVWITLEEALLGFVFGVIGGIVMGVLLGEMPYLADVVGPYIKIVNALPRIVLGSIFVMWLGLGLSSKVMLAAVLVFFVVFFNAFQGVSSVDRNFVANTRILGASRLQVVQYVVFPSAMTWIIASLHVALGFSIIGAIVGEFLGAQKGLGLVIATAQNTFDANGVFGAMLVIGVLALSAEGLMAMAEKRLLAWQPVIVREQHAGDLTGTPRRRRISNETQNLIVTKGSRRPCLGRAGFEGRGGRGRSGAARGRHRDRQCGRHRGLDAHRQHHGGWNRQADLPALPARQEPGLSTRNTA